MKGGPIGMPEYERLTSRLGGERYLRRRPAGFREDLGLRERIALAVAADETIPAVTATVMGTDPRIAAMAAERARAQLAALGRRETAMTLQLSVPAGMPEAAVREYLRNAYAAAAWSDIAIVREERAEVTAGVSAFGECTAAAAQEETTSEEAAESAACESGKEQCTAAAEAGETLYIVASGYIGIEGTLLLYEESRAELEARYPRHFLKKIESMHGKTATAERIRAGRNGGALYAVPCGDGGIYAALWTLGERLRCGMKIELPTIPIDQLTIELCELQDRDPYMMPSGGCEIYVTAEPERLLRTLREYAAGRTPDNETESDLIEDTAVIGTLAMQQARVIKNRGEERYIEPYRGNV